MPKGILQITKELEDYDALYKHALDAAEVGVWQWDFETDELKYDYRMRNLYELEPNEKVNYDTWRKKVHPQDLIGLEKQLEDCINNGVPYIYWFRIKSYKYPSGWKYIKGKGKVIYNEYGKAIGMTGVNIESDCPAEFDKRMEKPILGQAK